MEQRPFWYLLNIYGWIIFIMSCVTAIVVGQAWIVLLGVIGYQIAIIVDLVAGRSLGRTGAIRLARAEQERRELLSEKERLLGAMRERDESIKKLQSIRDENVSSQEQES